MFGILFRAAVKPEEQENFINFFNWDIQVAKERQPGTRRFDVYQDDKDENAFFVHEEYQDEKAFKDHKRGDPFIRWESEILPKVVTRFDRSRPGDPLRSLTPNEQITDAERAFRTRDYELKANYLTGQFNRMWQRFQFFITIQAALIGGKTYFGEQATIPLGFFIFTTGSRPIAVCPCQN